MRVALFRFVSLIFGLGAFLGGLMIMTSLVPPVFSETAKSTKTLKVAPIVPGAWKVVNSLKGIQLNYELDSVLDSAKLDIKYDTEFLRELELPFYPQENAILFELPATIDSPVEEGHTLKISGALSFLRSNGQIWLLNGRTLSRDGLNASLGLTIDSNQDAYEYVRFFVNTLASGTDDFRMISFPDEILFDYKTNNMQPLPNEHEALIRGFYKSPEVHKVDNRTWHVSSTMLFKGVLFYNTFKVTADGAVEIVKEKPLTRELPFEQIIWESGVRLSSSDRAWRHRAWKVTQAYLEEKRAEQARLERERARLEKEQAELVRQIEKQKVLIADEEKLAGALLIMGDENAEITVHGYVNYLTPYVAAMFTRETVCKKRHEQNKVLGNTGSIWGSEVFCGRYWKFKRKYIDTGKMRFVVHEFIFGRERDEHPAILARCISQEKVVSYFFQYMERFPYITSDKEWPFGLLRLVRELDPNVDYKECLGSTKNKNFKEQVRQTYRDFGIKAVPNFRIDGRSEVYNLPELIEALSNYGFDK